MAKTSEIKFQVDARTLRSFKKNVSIAGRGVVNSTKDGLIEFCEEVLLDSVQLVPIDTGALAQSNDYKITGSAKKGYKAKLGYAIGKRNPVNRRTGQRASSYAGTVHEHIVQHENGQAKFFEQALYRHENELETYTGKAIKKYLSSAVIGEFDGEHEENEGESKRQAIIAGRSQQGFTEQVDGKLLPFPVPNGMVYYKGGRWWLNKKYKGKKAHGKKGKTSKATERDVRLKEIHRYTAEKAPTKKRTKRTSKRQTTSKKQASKVSKKQSKTSKSIKGARTPANKRTTKRSKFIGELAHETALDEYMQYLIDEGAEKRKRKKKEEEEKRRW